MKLPLGLLILFSVVQHRLLLAQQLKVRFRDISPPAFHTGTVFYAFYDSATDDPDFVNLNLPQFDGMTAAIYMPYGGWGAANEAVNTVLFKKLVDKLKASNNKVIHGSILVYPNNNLELSWWVQQPDSLVETRMYQYIDALTTARKGKIWVWNVVNEPMGDDYDVMDQDGIRILFGDQPIREYQAMGPSYIAKAFQRAHTKDPNALLILTDYYCEEDNPANNNDKSDRLLRFVKKLKSQKVPIHGVGLQFHLNSIPGMEPNYTRIVLNFERFRKAGFLIFITELDVISYRTTNPSRVTNSTLQAAAERQALVYSRVLKICLNEPACKCAFMWDDAEYNSRNPGKKYAFLHPLSVDPTSAPVYLYPTPFWDINPNHLSPKPAWYAMQNALSNFTGVYRVTSLWTPASGYLSRSGPTTPGLTLYLTKLNTQSSTWTSMKWRFERVAIGIYRIACTWGYTSGYLGRAGVLNPITQEYDTADTVYVESRHLDWGSQQWSLEYVYDNQYRITNVWGANGTLTRLGISDQNGNVVPTNQVILAPTNRKSSSQIWRLERVWSAGDTKTAADAFWL